MKIKGEYWPKNGLCKGPWNLNKVGREQRWEVQRKGESTDRAPIQGTSPGHWRRDAVGVPEPEHWTSVKEKMWCPVFKFSEMQQFLMDKTEGVSSEQVAQAPRDSSRRSWLQKEREAGVYWGAGPIVHRRWRLPSLMTIKVERKPTNQCQH